jgi:hypothetical protein
VPLAALWIALSYWLGRRQEAATDTGRTTKPTLPAVP